MSANEIVGRTKERFYQIRERRKYYRGAGRNVSDVEEVALSRGNDRSQLELAVLNLVPGAVCAELAEFKSRFPHEHDMLAERCRTTAHNVLSGSWKLLGHPVDFQKAIDWHRDPRSDFRWQRRFYADLPIYNLLDNVDIKYVWELGRHQYLVDLARGWLFGGGEDFAIRARELLMDWIEQNPLYEGVHWTSGLEVAMRAISWLWTLATLAEWEGWQPGESSTIASSLKDHATYLEHHFSFYSSPYNHLIGEATALYLIGATFDATDEGKRWQSRGREVLLEHGPRQFYGDGFSVEQATGYHFYTLGFLTMAVAAARTANAPLGELETVIHHAYRAAGIMRQPDGTWPAIGDVDSARSIPVPCENFWDFRSLCATAATLFDDPVLKAETIEPGDELYWLMGCEGLQKWKELPRAVAPKSAVLTDSGYAVTRNGDDWLLFDSGPIADGLHPDATPSTAHGHADALQVLFHLGGRPILCDSGMPFYAGPRDWIDHFRGPAAHNTVEIEDAPMAQIAGHLAWSHVAPRPTLQIGDSKQVWTAVGRVSWTKGVALDRYVAWIPDAGLWVIDWVTLDRPRRVRWYWQTHCPIRDCIGREPNGIIARGGGVVLGSWFDTGNPVAIVEEARTDSAAAWRAPGYGYRIQGQRIVEEIEGPQRMLKAFYAGPCECAFKFSLGDRSVGFNWHREQPEQKPTRCGEGTWQFGHLNQAISVSSASELDVTNVPRPERSAGVEKEPPT